MWTKDEITYTRYLHAFLSDDFHLTAWTEREMVNDIRHDMLSRNETKCVVLSDGSDQELALHESEVVPNADAWPCTERNVGRAQQKLLALRCESLRLKAFRFGEIVRTPMERVG